MKETIPNLSSGSARCRKMCQTCQRVLLLSLENDHGSRAPIWNRFCPWPEPPGHALLDRFDRLAARRNVRLVLGVLGVESGLLLLALRGRIRDGRLGILAVLLVLDLRCLILKIPLEGKGGNGGEGIIFQATNLPSHFPSMICKCFQTQMREVLQKLQIVGLDFGAVRKLDLQIILI